MAADSKTKKKEGHLAKQVRVAREVGREPKLVLPLMRRWILGLWQAKGGGFYGLGYVIAFVGREIRTLAGSIGDDSVSGFVMQQMFEFASRICVESIINAFLALLWPAFLLEWLGGWGIVVLVAGYFGFEYGLRPVVETWAPELKEAAERKRRKKRAG